MKSFIRRTALICVILGMLIPIQGVDDSSGFGWDDSASFENVHSGSGELPPAESRFE